MKACQSKLGRNWAVASTALIQSRSVQMTSIFRPVNITPHSPKTKDQGQQQKPQQPISKSYRVSSLVFF